MLIKSGDGSEFSLTVEGYQFPGNVADKYDANWLIISIDVKVPKGAWSAKGPYLLQWEAEQLATWLEGVTKGAPFGDHIEFMEPNLAFGLVERSAEEVTLRVHVEAEFRPPWSEHFSDKRGVVGYGSSVDFRLSPQDLMNAAGSLRSDLSRYPVRKTKESPL